MVAILSIHDVIRYGDGEAKRVNEKSLSPPVRDFVREYIFNGNNMDWILECVNGQRLCTDLLGPF